MRRLWEIGIMAVILSGCAEIAGSGRHVPVPSVRVECSTAGCRSVGATINAYIIYTTSGCSSPSFGEVVSGSGSVFCAGSGCSGTVSTFYDSNGQVVSSIPDGSYSVCVTVDRDGNYAGSPVSGDSYGTLSTSLIVNEPVSVTVSSFSDL